MLHRQVAILTGPDTHLDHLGVFAHLMDIPLIVTEETAYEAAHCFYPDLRVEKKDLQELSAEFLARHFDVIFESGRFFTKELDPLFKLFHQKRMRFVFCPHGNSDKGHSFQEHAKQDISLAYGPHMVNQLTQTGARRAIDHLILTGNYRLFFYEQRKNFYDALVEKTLLPKKDPSKPTLLYAPTWQDGENASSFFESTGKLIESLQPDFNLIIKLHPLLEAFHPAHTYHILSLYESTKRVMFLLNFPPIYPLLAACDLYIGDYSSIGYDFLAFDRPLYFLGEKASPLHSSGLTLPSDKEPLSFIQATLEQNRQEKSPMRRALYSHAFGTDFSLFKLREDLAKALLSS